jgi:hypothetical protein
VLELFGALGNRTVFPVGGILPRSCLPSSASAYAALIGLIIWHWELIYITKCEKFSHGCVAGSRQVADRKFAGLLLVLGFRDSPR